MLNSFSDGYLRGGASTRRDSKLVSEITDCAKQSLRVLRACATFAVLSSSIVSPCHLGSPQTSNLLCSLYRRAYFPSLNAIPLGRAPISQTLYDFHPSPERLVRLATTSASSARETVFIVNSAIPKIKRFHVFSVSVTNHSQWES